jgi:hypothetical protein
MDSKLKFIQDLLVLIAQYDAWDTLYWNSSLEFYISCNDIFYWGCADAEDVNKKTFPILRKAFKDAGNDGVLLYCARQRKMRPQGAAYKFVDKKHWHLFDACGSERKPDFGNPEARPKGS